jgi:hypothetical protein
VLSLRLKLRLAGVDFQGDPDGFLTLTVVSPRRISVVVERPELHGLASHVGAVAIARTQLEPNDKVARGFAALADLRVPEGVPPASLLNWRRFQDAAGRLKPGMVFPQSGLPQAMSQFIEQVRKDLVNAIGRSCLALRWRHSLDGPHNPLRPLSAGPEWSLDGSTWHPLPADIDPRYPQAPAINPTMSVASDVQALLDTGQDEPIAHQIFRDAWDNRFSNRRGAVVIGLSALELAIQTAVSRAAPTAQWLITTQPLPPIRRLLAEYLPALADSSSESRPPTPPKAVLDLIDKAVAARQRVAGSGSDDLSHEAVEEMLSAIKDALWLLDFYGGVPWAVSHLTPATRSALGLTRDDDLV